MNISRAWTGCHWYDCPPKSTCPIISYKNIDFDLRLFLFTLIFPATQLVSGDGYL